jgi:hypothetical protein
VGIKVIKTIETIRFNYKKGFLLKARVEIKGFKAIKIIGFNCKKGFKIKTAFNKLNNIIINIVYKNFFLKVRTKVKIKIRVFKAIKIISILKIIEIIIRVIKIKTIKGIDLKALSFYIKYNKIIL